ncbi:MAG: 50S ribosomal protein L20 [Clostridia bacterium]|jgi:large subunit ribosomal protein L20|nr:50S ribosomal protein L20 [Clostridia bacterium]
MSRVKNSVATRARRKKVIKLAKGYYGRKSTVFKTANQAVVRSATYAYRDRKAKKRDFRKLWITRINAAARINGTTYSKLMNALKKNNIELNRKVLADMAVNDKAAFAKLVAQVNA